MSMTDTRRSEYVMTKDVPGEYGIPRQTVLRLMREGALPGHRVTQKITLFKRSDIEAFIASRAATTDEQTGT